MARYIGPLAWAWIIIVGGLMLFPGGIECIKCGPTLTKVLGVISILIGIAGFVLGRPTAVAPPVAR
ncbi:MAG TPA: hypothetical protein VGG03_16265 [Thermoanaerobaculia bacterium]|jgi:hypothetical protein